MTANFMSYLWPKDGVVSTASVAQSDDVPSQ
jgi:hypothetical protein